MIKITQLDALDFLETIHDETVDVLITDPPYWTLDKWRKMGTTTRLGGHHQKDKQRDEMFFETIDYDYLWRAFLEFDRVLKLDGHLYVFCDDQIAPILLNWIREAQGDHRFGEAHALVWDKINMGMGYHYRRTYELIIFAWREKRSGIRAFKKRRLANLGVMDILREKRIANSKDSYPTEKPVAVIQTLLSQSAHNGDVIVDPFAGSGSLAAACPPELDLTFYLNDKSPAAIEHMKNRWAEQSLTRYGRERKT